MRSYSALPLLALQRAIGREDADWCAAILAPGFTGHIARRGLAVAFYLSLEDMFKELCSVGSVGEGHVNPPLSNRGVSSENLTPSQTTPTPRLIDFECDFQTTRDW